MRGGNETACQHEDFDEPQCRAQDGGGSEGRIEAVLESVHAVVAFVADKLAKVASDEVTDGAEADLLLPVREEERERCCEAKAIP